MKELILKTEGATLTAQILCELDHHAAKPIREEIDRALFRERPDRLILDFSAVRFMDSSGIGLILGRLSLCEELGCVTEARGFSPALSRIVRLSGIARLPHLTVIDAPACTPGK